MKHIIESFVFTGVLLFIFSTPILAETMYVSDILKLTVRAGKGQEYKIISVIQSGQTVEVLQPEDKWAFVRLSDGKEGWVLSRYLTSRITNNVKLQWLQKKHKALTVQATTLLEENTKLKKEKKELDSLLKKADKSVEELNKSYDTLKTESADYIKLKSKFKKTASQLAEYTEKSELLEKELTKLEFRRTIRWFLAGAGVLLLGFLIGIGTKRQRRRTTLR